RILPEMGPEMGEYASRVMRDRGMEILMETRLESCVEGYVELSNGESFEADTVVWTAGVKPSPVLAKSDLPLGRKGHVICSPSLQVTTEGGEIVAGAWAAGDCAQVPDLTKEQPAYCAPSAQHAVRQARHLGKNLSRHLR